MPIVNNLLILTFITIAYLQLIRSYCTTHLLPSADYNICVFSLPQSASDQPALYVLPPKPRCTQHACESSILNFSLAVITFKSRSTLSYRLFLLSQTHDCGILFVCIPRSVIKYYVKQHLLRSMKHYSKVWLDEKTCNSVIWM